jgi:hypothetical protein
MNKLIANKSSAPPAGFRARIAFVFLVTIGLCGLGFVHAQEDPNETDSVRGVFVSTRPGTSSGSASRRTNSNARRGSGNSRANTSRRTGAGNSNRRTTAGNSSRRPTTNASIENMAGGGGSTPALTSVGLGYTLFMRGPQGAAVRVDPSTRFSAGDAIRLTFESNIDGYLYVFHTESDRNPQMLFPDARLNGGVNLITAHVPYEVPSSLEADERNRWFVFDAQAATERLYVVVTREPLPGVPTGEALIAYCRGNANCTWRPDANVWQQLRAAAVSAGVQTSRSREYGQTQTGDEREAATRGAPMTRQSVQPAVVRVNSSPQTPILVTTIDLVHQ